MEVGDEVKHASEKAVEATPAPNEMAQAFQRALAKDPYCPEDHQLTAEEFWGGATSFSHVFARFSPSKGFSIEKAAVLFHVGQAMKMTGRV